MTSSKPIEAIVAALESHDRGRLRPALDGLASSPTASDLAALAAVAFARIEANSMDEWERSEVVKLLVEADVDRAQFGSDQVAVILTLLRTALRDTDWITRGWAVEALGAFASDADHDVLRVVALSDPHDWVRSDAMDALYDLDREALDGVIREVLAHEGPDSYTWWVAAVYAASAGQPIDVAPIDSLLVEDEELVIRLLATVRHLLTLEPQAAAVASVMVSSLRRGHDLPPIVAEECDLLAHLAT